MVVPVEVVIVSAVRTPIGRFNGGLASIPSPRLGALVIEEALKRARIDSNSVDEVIMGIVLQAGCGQNPARQSAIYASLPFEVPCLTVNKVCGSSLKSVMLAAQSIKAGDSEIVIAGGMENMSRAPYLLTRARTGYRLGDGKLVDGMIFDGLWDIYNDFHMGVTGEIVAERYNITRRMADEFSLESHKKALKAQEEGKFLKEIVPIKVVGKKGTQVIEKDEGPRKDTSLEKLETLKPVFRKDGIVTAGNASQISDGASCCVVMAKDKAQELGIKPLVKIVDYNVSGVKPELVMEAPIPGIKAIMERNSFEVKDIDLFEHNEAFATASCAVMKEVGIPPSKFNIHGGAVALGHPIGASGTRVLTTLIHALKYYKKKRGLASLCLGGGNAVQMIVENV